MPITVHHDLPAAAATPDVQELESERDEHSRDDAGGTELPLGLGGPAAARAVVRRACAAGGVDESVTSVATLLVSELVSDAVLYAGGATRLTVTAHPSRRLRVTVTDAGALHQQATEATPETARPGSGPHLLETLSTHWGRHATPSGALVWFDLDPTRRLT